MEIIAISLITIFLTLVILFFVFKNRKRKTSKIEQALKMTLFSVKIPKKKMCIRDRLKKETQLKKEML